MKYVYLALNWIFGFLSLLIGTVSIIESPFAGLSLILISLLLLPPVRNFAHSKIKKELPTKVRGVAIFILFIAFVVFVGQSQDRKAQELAVQEAQEQAERVASLRQQNIDYFNNNSSKILSQIKAALDNANYKEAVSLFSKYLPSKNKELIDLHGEAKSRLAAIAKAEKEEKEKAKSKLAAIAKAKKEAKEKAERKVKTEEILAKLKSIPASQYERNRAFYQQLVTYNPSVDKYKNKLSYYSGKIKEENEKERRKKEKIRKKREARIAKFGETPVQSPWDGSYRAVERYLERVANDSDSIEMDGCTEVDHIKEGWLVGCNYRGRNAFGGMVRQSNWFTIVHGRVNQKHKASAYKP